jgi:hypothetical protein
MNMENQNENQEQQTNAAPPDNTPQMQPTVEQSPQPTPQVVPTEQPAAPPIPVQPPMPSASVSPAPTAQPTIGGAADAMTAQVGTKNYVVALVLSYLVGSLGVDRFYVGKIWTGILKLITFGGFGVWWLIDFLLIGLGKFKDKKGLKLSGYDTAGHVGKPVTIVLVIVNLVIIVPLTLLITLVAMGNVQMAARDAARQNDINQLVAELNGVYGTYSAYPSLEELNDQAWRNQVAPGITASMLSDPQAAEQTDPKLVATPEPKVYAYEAVAFGGGPCVSGTGCASYTLTYYSEQDGTNVVYSSLENN